MKKMIYSDSLDEMVVESFYMKLKSGGFRRYSWSDEDCVWYADDVDDRWYDEVPERALYQIPEGATVA